MTKSQTTNGMVIHKYVIEITGDNGLRIPSPYKFLSFQAQGKKLCAWFAVNPNPSSDCYADIELRVIGTGHAINPGGSGYNKVPIYLGTAQLDDFVWHLFQNRTYGEILNG
jgi:hypothetical protein